MRLVQKLVAAFLMLSLAAACGGAGSDRDAATVVVALPNDTPGDIKARRELASLFEKEHPGIPVEILLVPSGGYQEKVITMIAGGKPPDIFVSGEVLIPVLVDKNYATDLTSFVEKDDYDLSGFYPQIIDGLTFENKLVGLTDNWDTQVMYYNKSLFDEAGVDYPNKNWTWEDFLAAARAITRGEGADKVFGAAYETWFAPLYDQIWSFGGDIFTPDGTSCALDSPQSVAAIQSLADLFEEGLAPGPTQMGQMGQDAFQLFLAGRAAMMIGSGRWAAYELAAAEGLDWAMAPRPIGPAERSNFFHLSMFVIASTSENPEEAWEFLKFMVGPENMRRTVENQSGIPALESVANSPSFRKSSIVGGVDTVTPLFQSLPTAHEANFPDGWDPAQEEVDAFLDDVWTGNKTAADVASAMCDAVDEHLADAAED